MEDFTVHLRIVEKLGHREEYELPFLSDQKRFYLIQRVSIIIFELFRQEIIDIVVTY